MKILFAFVVMGTLLVLVVGGIGAALIRSDEGNRREDARKREREAAELAYLEERISVCRRQGGIEQLAREGKYLGCNLPNPAFKLFQARN